MRPVRLSLALLALALAPSFPARAEEALDPLTEGFFESRPTSSGVVIAAPHGGFDRYTEGIARRIAQESGSGYLIAMGYRTRRHLWNVNRPTAGVGLSPADETRPPEAARVFDAYAAQVKALAPRLYVEIHGNARPESAGAIECATWNLSDETAAALKAACLRRFAALPAGLPKAGFRVEPFDTLHYRASSAKKDGVYPLVPRGLQMEWPVALRDPAASDAYAKAIAAALGDVPGLLAP